MPKMTTKTCTRCSTDRPIEDFRVRTNGRPDSWCKPCNTKRAMDWQKANPVRRAAKQRENYDPAAARRRHENQMATEEGRRTVRARNAKSRSKHARKESARRQLRKAVKDGIVLKPDSCQDCGAKGRIHGHHPDYAKPLAVEWLCPTCHETRHHPAAYDKAVT